MKDSKPLPGASAENPDPAILIQTESSVLETGEALATPASLTDSDTITRLVFGAKTYILIGTAHISAESVAEVRHVLENLQPDRVCIELDQGRYTSMTQADNWKNLDIFKVIKSGKGFMLLANLVLGSFQKRMGLDNDSKPGEEMREAIRFCQEKEIPFSLIDRDIQVTLRRAWAKSSFWGKNKLLAALVGSAFSSEKMDAQQIEDLKKKSALQGMMEELGNYLPSVKSVLIDERDQFLACRLFSETGDNLVAVVGAGHVPGITRWLTDLHAGKASSDLDAISQVPKPGKLGKVLTWVVPLAILGLIAYAFAHSGWQTGLASLFTWWLIHGSLVALGTLLALGHPVTIVLGFILSPLGSFHILGAVGIVTGGIQAWISKPRVSDLENLQTDITSFRGFYRNRVTRVLLVFVLSSLGGVVGNILAALAIIPK